ncbi:helix-turn-helix transcriptional regulator [Chromobacterium paludis]|uniref:AlpA family phage regulatory protein n=1 Tax=Chromobacterium paludis TaxID=2605945 RepID=A0A5C1DIW2_9NEIS|nr:AlpA family phage regulatory protein [Chromobacterium paludis]
MTVKYIRPSQVAQRYTVARSTVYRWIKNDPSFPHPRAVSNSKCNTLIRCCHGLTLPTTLR